MQPLEFTIGRDGDEADIVITGEQRSTVSRLHARARMDAESGLFRVEDLHSSNGLFVMYHGAWKRIEKGLVEPSVPVRFGFQETTFAQLMPQIQKLLGRKQAEQPRGPRLAGNILPVEKDGAHPRRNPETGEIID